MVDKKENPIVKSCGYILVCIGFALAGCTVLDNVAAGLVKPKEPVNHGMTIDEYAAWYNSHAKDNPGLIDPKDETPAIAEPIEFEPTKLAKGLEGAASVAPIPYLREGVEGAVLLAGLWSLYRENRNKKGIAKVLVESIDKEGSEKLKDLVEKKSARAGFSKPIHKIVKIVKAAKALTEKT